MIKISALNVESEEGSDNEDEVTPEAEEQIALQQYSKALDLQRKGNLSDATQLLKDLLVTEVLYDVKKPESGEKITSPLFKLKYLCYKNLASMLAASGNSDSAIEAYITASELDATDLTLWYRMGLQCMSIERYEMALYAFQRAVQINYKHWPSIDKIVTLLLGLEYKQECIATIYEALKLDPGYLRGIVYRRHIFKIYKYVKDYLEYLNPIYTWIDRDEDEIDEDIATKLLNEAEHISKVVLQQQRAAEVKYVMPELQIMKPISSLTWSALGDSLVNMHIYITEHAYSHACLLELKFEKKQEEEPMDIMEEQRKSDSSESKTRENNSEAEKHTENGSENENNDLSDKEKAATDSEKVESDVEIINAEVIAETLQEPKKKPPVRRRPRDLNNLQQWEWCNRRSGRNQTVNKDESIYGILRQMVPNWLIHDNEKNNENQVRATSPYLKDLVMLFEETESIDKKNSDIYFGTENEQKDVQDFINKYTEKKHDIIDMLKEFLEKLSLKWKMLWPQGLDTIFIEANKCYNNHIDEPTCTSDDHDALVHYTTVNLMAEELELNKKFNSPHDQLTHELCVIEAVGMILYMKPDIFSGTECMEFILRYHWVKVYIHHLNKCDDFCLNCLYELTHEFESMGEHHDTYSLNVVNFKVEPCINEKKIFAFVRFLERNKKLSTVMELYKKHCYEEVLTIISDSIEHCKNMAKTQEEEMSLDFSVQLTLLLDTCWALDKVDDCFRWSLICLHEALKHYFRYTSSSPDYEKWTNCISKILSSMEHILTTKGLVCLDAISRKDLSECLEDLIRIIGHQVETNAADMPFGTVAPWIVMYYILQREEDLGRIRIDNDTEESSCTNVPNTFMVLFLAHIQLGHRNWCCQEDGKLLFFTLDTVVPRLRAPCLSETLDQITKYMEQCVYCLFGHPTKKKVKYIVDHNATPFPLDWPRAQQVYEIFKPPNIPALKGKNLVITPDTEQLFQRILALFPPEYEFTKYVPDIEKYISGIENKLPSVAVQLPYKIKDIYFLLGDYYFKKKNEKMGMQFITLDIVVNNNRLESWAKITFAKAAYLKGILTSCKNINNEREYLNPAKAIVRCFKKLLEIDPSDCTILIKYGIFVYSVHSFCSRLLKQNSESLSMEDFAALEKQKEEMLDTTHKCFLTVMQIRNKSADTDKTNDDSWLCCYMLGKVAEKRNGPPSEYLDYYLKGFNTHQKIKTVYPLKINSNNTTRIQQSIEVLELQYRIHASILKYIEQHENKPIPASVGTVFSECIKEWNAGMFSKKFKEDETSKMDAESKSNEPVLAANVHKRSISDAGEENNQEAKILKLESAAAKVRRSASYDAERLAVAKEQQPINTVSNTFEDQSLSVADEKQENLATMEVDEPDKSTHSEKSLDYNAETALREAKKLDSVVIKSSTEVEKKEESSSSATSTSSSSSSSYSSDSSSDENEILAIVSSCLDALEDCVSRFPRHYKAIYRLAHYHFYYKKGKDIERCRDMMLSNFVSRAGQKLAGLFSERKHANFFNQVWKILHNEVDRAGGFAFHMSRCVQLTITILKEIDDHETLLDISLQLQKTPDQDKTYLRHSDREDLARQAFSLCVQSLKGQLLKFSQQADLKSNEIEQQALKSLMIDIYNAYQKVPKQSNSKPLVNLITDAYKLLAVGLTETMNLVDLSMKFCQSLTRTSMNLATQASLDKPQNTVKKQTVKTVPFETPKQIVSPSMQHKTEKKISSTIPSTIPPLPKMSQNDMTAAFQSYIPMLDNSMLSQQTAAALSISYLSNISALAGYSSLQNTLQTSLQSSLQNNFQEFYRQYISQTLSPFNNLAPPPKRKRGPKPLNRTAPVPINTTQPCSSQLQQKASKPCSQSVITSSTKPTSTPVIMSLQKSTSAPLAPSMGTVLSTLPASMTANVSLFGEATSHSRSNAHSSVPQAHMSSSSSVVAALNTKPPMPHQQVSPGKTLQEKLAERQKNLPAVSSSEITASISRLPSSLTITKSSISKQSSGILKKPEAKKSLSFPTEVRPKPITSDEVIVLDDDDD